MTKAAKYARAIVEARDKAPILTTGQLAGISDVDVFSFDVTGLDFYSLELEGSFSDRLNAQGRVLSL